MVASHSLASPLLLSLSLSLFSKGLSLIWIAGAKLKHHGMHGARSAGWLSERQRRCHPNTTPPLSRFCICRCQTWPRQASMVGSLPPSLLRPLGGDTCKLTFVKRRRTQWMLEAGVAQKSAERHATSYEKSRDASGRACERGVGWSGVAARHSRQLLNCGSIN